MAPYHRGDDHAGRSLVIFHVCLIFVVSPSARCLSRAAIIMGTFMACAILSFRTDGGDAHWSFWRPRLPWDTSTKAERRFAGLSPDPSWLDISSLQARMYSLRAGIRLEIGRMFVERA